MNFTSSLLKEILINQYNENENYSDDEILVSKKALSKNWI